VPGAQQPPAGAQTPGAQQPPAGAPPLSQGGQGAGIPDGGPLPPLPRRSEKKVQKGGGGGRLVVTALIAGLVAALLVLLLMPWAFGVNPYDLVRGKLKKAVVLEEKAEPGRNVTVVSPTEGSMSVTSISKAVIPSIVNIDIRTAPQQTPLFTTQAQEGTGSGVIYTQDGYIITNNHVVEGAQQITVTLASGESVPGKVVGADAENDIAVVKIEKTGLPAISFGNSDNLVVGQLAVAVGSPFGFEQTVTSGIISALHRSISTGSQTTGQASTLTDLIQTDASINPGNSGGALCDGNAKLVGINAVIASQSGGSEGIGFAIPANTAKLVADNIIGGKPISHPYIGILGQTVSQDIATQYNLPVNTGAYVTNVVPDGPAAKAGIKAGDIIVAIDGTPVKSMDDLVAQVRKSQVGSTVTVTYYAGNDKKTTQVTLEEKPKNATQ
jgi:S1-C subfamily serine protease